MKVFIVDNSDVVRTRLLMMLADVEGIEIVGQARTAETALRQIQPLKPDLVILDIQMPGVDGLQALQQIKQRQADTIVIMLTNYPYLLMKIKCLNAGADYFFDKSSEIEQMLETIQTMAKGK